MGKYLSDLLSKIPRREFTQSSRRITSELHFQPFLLSVADPPRLQELHQMSDFHYILIRSNRSNMCTVLISWERLECRVPQFTFLMSIVVFTIPNFLSRTYQEHPRNANKKGEKTLAKEKDAQTTECAKHRFSIVPKLWPWINCLV